MTYNPKGNEIICEEIYNNRHRLWGSYGLVMFCITMVRFHLTNQIQSISPTFSHIDLTYEIVHHYSGGQE